MNQTFMKEKAPVPLVITMSLPMVISMLVNSLYNIIDSYFVAKISEDAMTALSIVYPLQILMTAVGVGFGIGINAAVAFFLGAGDEKATGGSAGWGIVLSILHGFLLMAGCLIGLPAFVRLFTQEEAVISYALTYANIVFLFAIIITVEVVFEKLFQAVGRMKVSMVSMMAGCLINIVLDPVLIFGAGPIPAMGITGAAIATGIGQIATLVIYLTVYVVKPLPLTISKENLQEGKKHLGRLYGVGVPAALNMALPSLLITALNGILSSYGEVYVLILGIYYKLQTFIYLTANGIVQGIRPLVGYNYGAGEYKRVTKIHQAALVLALGVMAVGMVLCLICGPQLIGLFTDSQETMETGAVALQIISLGFLVSAVSVITCGTLEGLGKGTLSLTLSLIRYVLMIPIAYALSLFLQAYGVWHGFWVTEGIAALLALFLYRSQIKGTTLAGRRNE